MTLEGREVDVPDEGVVTTEIHLVTWLMPDGGQRWGIRVTGAETGTSPIVGMLEMAKHRFLRNNEEENGSG